MENCIFNSKDEELKMNILFLSFSDTRFDGRLRELLCVALELGKVFSVIRFNENSDDSNWSLKGNSFFSVFEFIHKAKRLAEKMSRVDIIFIDNRMGCIPGLLLERRYKQARIIQDVRELYISSEQKSVKAKIGCWIERRAMGKANFIICANKYRAVKMKRIFNLNKLPTVFENIRKLEYGKNFKREDYDRKYSFLLKSLKTKIICTSGWVLERTNDKLVLAVSKLSDEVELLMVGTGKEKDKEIIKEIISKEKISNVHILGQVQEEELKYLISISKIGIVNYGKYDLNNLLCASGKIYEFIFEGIPVVTTENLPLIEICQKYKIGESDDEYIDAIKNVLVNYKEYKENVVNMAKKISIGRNNERLVTAIKKELLF